MEVPSRSAGVGSKLQDAAGVVPAQWRAGPPRADAEHLLPRQQCLVAGDISHLQFVLPHSLIYVVQAHKLEVDRQIALLPGIVSSIEIHSSLSGLALQSSLSMEMPAMTFKTMEAASEVPPTSSPLPPLPPSASQLTAPSPPPLAPAAAIPEPASAPVVPAVAVAPAAPPAATTAAASAMAAAVMQQLESVTTAVNSSAEAGAPAERSERSSEQNVTAATAAANAAAALGQLAAALAGQAPPELPTAIVVPPVVAAAPVQSEPATAEAPAVVETGVAVSEAGSGEVSAPSLGDSSTEASKDQN